MSSPPSLTLVDQIEIERQHERLCVRLALVAFAVAVVMGVAVTVLR